MTFNLAELHMNWMTFSLAEHSTEPTYWMTFNLAEL